MNKPLRVFFTVFMSVFLLLGWIVECAVHIIIWLPLYLTFDRAARYNIHGVWHRLVNIAVMVHANPIWKVVVVKPFTAPPPGAKVLLMPNHLSNADSFTLYSAIWPTECKFIAKASLYKIPFGGWGGAFAGDLRVHFTSAKGGWGTRPGSTDDLMKQCVYWLENRTPIIVFPEGVRNPNPAGPIGELRHGMFKFAIEQGTTLIPVAISGTEKCWPVHSALFDAGTIYLSFCDPISPVGKTMEGLKEEVRSALNAARDAHPDRATAKRD